MEFIIFLEKVDNKKSIVSLLSIIGKNKNRGGVRVWC